MKQQAQLFKALADETRLRILLLLLKHGELCVCDLMASLESPQSSVSRHLTYLRNAGFVDGERRGVWMYYRILGGSGLGAAVLADIEKYCRDLARAKGDSQRYAEYLLTKSKDACAAQTSAS